MNAIDAVKACTALGGLGCAAIEAALNEDFASRMDIDHIRAVRKSDGKTVLSARLDHIETGYEFFVHPVCVYGEDGKPLYETREGRKADDGPYVWRRETETIGSPADVDAYVAARADEAIRVELDLRSQRPEEIARRERMERQERERREAAAEAERALEAETAEAAIYSEKLHHAVNAIRKGCGHAYVKGIVAEARKHMDAVSRNRYLLGLEPIRLYGRDLSAAWDAWRRLKADWEHGRRGQGDCEQLRNYLSMHRKDGGLSPSLALYAMSVAYGYEDAAAPLWARQD